MDRSSLKVVPTPPRGAEQTFNSTELTPLQGIIQGILDPEAAAKRTVREWRALYKTFFGHFAPDSDEPETHKKAWSIASAVFNRNLTAVRNRATLLVPMTFQDFIDAVDSFQYDGLRENGQRDIAWQPKKILLSMAAMIGRILAGWQADAAAAGGPPLSPFREYLVAENRKADFLGYLYDHDARFSVLEYRAAGLVPLLHSFPHGTDMLSENGLCRCERIVAGDPDLPPSLRLQFLRPLRVPISLRTVTQLDAVLLRAAEVVGETAGLDPNELLLERDPAVLEGFTFSAAATPAERAARTERLFEAALERRLLLCCAYRATQGTARALAQALGRTPAERFAVEHFFALGLRTGAGNEPWREIGQPPRADLDRNQLKQARRQFDQTKNTFSFFTLAGVPDSFALPGARGRQEMLDPKGDGASTFFALLQQPVYAPLMRLLLSARETGEWVVHEQDIHGLARGLNGGPGKLLAQSAALFQECEQSLRDPSERAAFRFECSLQIYLALSAQLKGATRLQGVRDSLRELCETQAGVPLGLAPSLAWDTPEQLAASVEAARARLQQAEESIWTLVEQSLDQPTADALREAQRQAIEEIRGLARLQTPRIPLDDRKELEKGLEALRDWLQRVADPDAAPAQSENPALAMARVRSLAEEGQWFAAVEAAAGQLPLLKRKQRTRLESFFSALAMRLLEPIERHVVEGHPDKATALAEKGRLLVDGSPSLPEFQAMLVECFRSGPKGAKGVTSLPAQLRPTVSLNPRARQAQTLLETYADELSLNDNLLEKEFLESLISGATFKRKDKLENRLKALNRWGGRDPHITSLKLLREG